NWPGISSGRVDRSWDVYSGLTSIPESVVVSTPSSRFGAASNSLAHAPLSSATFSCRYRTLMPFSLWFGPGRPGGSGRGGFGLRGGVPAPGRFRHQLSALAGQDLFGGGVRYTVPEQAMRQRGFGVQQPAGFRPGPLADEVRRLVFEPGLGALAGLTAGLLKLPVLLNGIHHVLGSLSFEGHRGHDGWLPGLRPDLGPLRRAGREQSPHAEHASDLLDGLLCTGEVGLVDHKHVADLHDPGLDHLDAVAHPWSQHYQRGVGDGGDLQFRLA